ncbi:nitrous oxide reductase family maturation protein NosD [Nitrosophilus alvini]|uniref:nitrous oxide reductase family maturation protein NosD n=1 Tax=Nitrosophilus alvini TaxID=2714855 RepID=UPI0019096DED|nr:nitrous oxide reductase family maturation protein NosD [Nitrosophilus alvini]
MKKILVLFMSASCILFGKNLLQEAIDKAAPGSLLELPEGEYHGNIIITKPLIIDGKNKKAFIIGEGKGTVVKVRSSNVILKNLTIKNSGTRHEDVDAGVSIKDSDFCEILNCDIEDTLFGIDLQNVHNSKIIGNKISSKPFSLGLRGDGIRVWYSNDNIFRKNSLVNSRDFVVWYSHGNIIEENYGENCRYSLHLMYAGKNIIKNNYYVHNSVGIFFMYSQDSEAVGNTIKNSLGNTGVGIGLKDVSNFIIKNNTVIYCARGFYIDRSPYQPDMNNTIEKNNILYNSEGIHFHSMSVGNIITDNIFKGNIENVINDTKEVKISQNIWDRNFWDDYEGFDKNRDGFGDTPYNLYYYADKMWLFNPNVKFFYGSPVISILNFLAKLAPFSEPVLLLTDKHPRMKGEIYD